MKIKYFAWLRNITGLNEETINDTNIKDINNLKDFVCTKYPELKKHIIKDDIIRFAINLEYTPKNKKLRSNDEIALFPPVSGG